jgi:hypothetical protein
MPYHSPTAVRGASIVRDPSRFFASESEAEAYADPACSDLVNCIDFPQPDSMGDDYAPSSSSPYDLYECFSVARAWFLLGFGTSIWYSRAINCP